MKLDLVPSDTFIGAIKNRLASDFVQSLIKRGLNALAVSLAAHGVIQKSQTQALVEVALSAATWGLEWLIDHWHIQRALATPPPGYVPADPVAITIAQSPKVSAQKSS